MTKPKHKRAAPAELAHRSGEVTKITPVPELKEAFEIFEAAFKIGAIYGLNLPIFYKTKAGHKRFIKWLESDEAKKLIYGLLIKEADPK